MPGYLIRSENYITWKVSIIEVSSISSSTWSSLSSPWMTSKVDKMNKGTREKARTPLSSNRWRHMPVSPSAISSSRTFSKQKSTLMNIIEWPKRLRLKTQSPTLHITSESFSKRKATEKKPSTIINPTLRQPSHRNLIKKTVNLWIRHEWPLLLPKPIRTWRSISDFSRVRIACDESSNGKSSAFLNDGFVLSTRLCKIRLMRDPSVDIYTAVA